MANFELKRVIAVLPAKDVAASVAFYKGKLGFTPYFDMGNYAGIGRGPIELHLFDETQPGPDRSAAQNTPVTVRVDVSGVDALYSEIDPAIVKADETLETKPFGQRQFTVLDPNGNRITFAQNVARA